MSGPPRLPPGISLQRAAPSPPLNLPPGISFKRATEDSSEEKLRNLPSSIQIQRSSDNSSTDAGINKLANLGIQISRTDDGPSNSAMQKLSGLGISVSGGPTSSSNKIPKLPPGVSLSGISSSPSPPPERTRSPPPSLQQRLPPGISLQGTREPSSHATSNITPPEHRRSLPQQPRLSGPGIIPAQPQLIHSPAQQQPQSRPQLASPPLRPPQVRQMRPRLQDPANIRTAQQSHVDGFTPVRPPVQRPQIRTMTPSQGQPRPALPSTKIENQRPPLDTQGQQRLMQAGPQSLPGNQMNSPSQASFKPQPPPLRPQMIQSTATIRPTVSGDGFPKQQEAVSSVNENAQPALENRAPHQKQGTPSLPEGISITGSNETKSSNNVPYSGTPSLPTGITINQSNETQSLSESEDSNQSQIPLEFQYKDSAPHDLKDSSTQQTERPKITDMKKPQTAVVQSTPEADVAMTSSVKASVISPKVTSGDDSAESEKEHSDNSESTDYNEGRLSIAENEAPEESTEASTEGRKEAEIAEESKDVKGDSEMTDNTDAPTEKSQEDMDQSENESSNPPSATNGEAGAEGMEEGTEQEGQAELGEYAEGEEYMEGYEDGEWEDYEGEEDWGEGVYDGYDGEEGYEYAGEEGGEELGGEASNLEGDETSNENEASKEDNTKAPEEETESVGDKSAKGDESSGSKSLAEAEQEKAPAPEPSTAAVEQSEEDESMEVEPAVPVEPVQTTPADKVMKPSECLSEPVNKPPPAPEVQSENLNGVPLGSPTTFSLPPGISISSNSEASNSSADLSVSCGSPQLPPGISISPFKKPSARPSTDEDARSSTSMDRDTVSLLDREDRSSDVSESVRSPSVDRNPRVGGDTNCVICSNRCSDRKPRLLLCLHSCCQDCFYDKLAEARREDTSADIVDIDGESIAFVPEVTCPICKTSTSESDSLPNYFVSESDQDDNYDEDTQVCGSCDDNLMATAKCAECDEFLCGDCVRAHQRVKMTKDHQITQVKSRNAGVQNYKYCQIHPNESLSLYCESCDMLNCRDCQLSEKHRNCKYRFSYEVAPEVKGNISQSASDIRMKKSHIEESCGILSTKISEVNIKEKSLLTQLKDVKDFIVQKVEDRYRELSAEVTKRTRDKRKTLQNRKNNLERSLWQTEHALAFIDHIVTGSIEDAKLLLSKKIVMRQLRKLKRVNQSINMSGPEMEFKLDLYFQHFSGINLHSNIDSVLKMICSDIKVSAIPIEPPKPKPAPPPPQPAAVPPLPSPVQQQPAPQMARNIPATPPNRVMSVGRGASNGVRASPVRGGGHHVRQLATPTKSPARIVAGSGGVVGSRGMSPARSHGQAPMMRGGGGSMATRGMPVAARGAAVGGVIRGGAVSARPGMPRMRGGRGRPAMAAGGAQGVRPIMAGAGGGVQMAGRQVTPVNRRVSRGGPMMTQRGGRGGSQVIMRGGSAGVRPMGVPQQRMGTPVMTNRRGRGSSQMPVKTSQYAAQNQMYTNAALGLNSQPQPRMKTQPRPRMQRMVNPGNASIRYPNNSQIPSQQNFNQGPVMVQPRAKAPKPAAAAASGTTLHSLQSALGSLQPVNLPDSLGSSWHTPTSANRPVSPPRVKDTNFKILLPKMGGGNADIAVGGGGGVKSSAPIVDLMGNSLAAARPAPPPAVKKESSPEIISLDDDDPPDVKKVLPNLSSANTRVINLPSSQKSGGVIVAGGNVSGVDPLTVTRPPADISISKMEFFPPVTAKDPLADLPIMNPSPPNSTTGSNPPSNPLNPVIVCSPVNSVITTKPVESVPMVAVNVTSVKPEEVKMEKQNRVEPLKISINKSTNSGTVVKPVVKLPGPAAPPVMQGKDGLDDGGDWCAVCHDGGDTLYCCDRCPKVYHMYCYIPPMQSEPADDWECIMCENKEGIDKFSNKTKKGCNLSERDFALCRRLLLEMYNRWPESVPFRDCADLNFEEYLDKIQEPIALDVIRDHLAEDSPNQYSSVRAFLADIRKMFRNAFIFNSKESEIYKHATKMEERLDQLLMYWAPQFANDPLLPDNKTQAGGAGGAGVKRKRDQSAGKRGRKARKNSGDSDEIQELGEDVLSEGEREDTEYIMAIQNSLKDLDPNDLDFDPSTARRGKGRGRPRGRKS